MTDILATCPSLSTTPFSHLIPSLERHAISVADLLTLDHVDVAKRAQLPAKEVRRLTDAIINHLHSDLGILSARDQLEDGDRHSIQPQGGQILQTSGVELAQAQGRTISLLSPSLDTALAGGIHTAALTEITGESSTAKTQFLLTLLLAVQLPASQGGLAKTAVYISTESALATSRLSQICSTHPILASLPPAEKPSLAKVLSISVPDLEAQEHILRYQLPVAIQRHNVGLVVIDSMTANYRAEVERGGGKNTSSRAGPSAMAARATSLQATGHLLRSLARRHNLAVVVANQVADRFERPQHPDLAVDGLPPGSMHSDDGYPSDPALTLDHQQRFFTGWGDTPYAYGGLKTPSLGLVWANQLDCRIALIRAARVQSSRKSGPKEGEQSRWRRWMKVAFASWAPDAVGERGVEFEIRSAGVIGLGDDELPDAEPDNGSAVADSKRSL
ncbi:hypothetical protein FH972_022397 [Carpinus fangiana]|uniref:RecA family profile 1 domain-containing protein n=1 Tax=Carpinus fangiana TaxID=176857 RepID=A0A5N6KSI3_9ROSI|nr:hypothetical protein FH972_022397 [Carpinus fangiana]